MRRSSMRQTNDASQLVVVAIDADKSSQHALKWTADHLIAKGQSFVLLHVRKKMATIPTPTGQNLPINEVDEEVASAFLEQMDLQARELLLPFQCFCSRRGLQCKEVILDDMDVPKAIINYLIQNSVDKIVLGASSRSAFARAFRQADVPTSVSKLAPDFCSVYVISKGKISSARPARRPNKSPIAREPSQESETPRHSFQSLKSETSASSHEEILQSPRVKSTRALQASGRGFGRLGYETRMNERINRYGQGGGHPDFSYQSTSSSSTSSEGPSRYATRDRLLADEQKRSFESNGSGWQYEQMRSFESDGTGMSEQLRSFESCRSGLSDQMRSFESNKSGTQPWSNASGTSGYGHVADSVASQNTEASWSLASMGRDPYSRHNEDVHNFEGGRFSTGSSGSVGERPWSRSSQESGTSKDMVGSGAARRLEERKPFRESEEKRKIMEAVSVDTRYRRYTLEEIEKATDYFSDQLKIGEGGYGPVFKSSLDNKFVAIKILRSNATQGMKQFQQEVEVLSCIQHPNMVLLMGACPEYGCLVYEYMANGSLEDRLFCRENTPPLSWQLRFKIAAEIATGLLFLHQTKPEPLVHRDLKPGNILLDDNFVSKIADVGLARLIPRAAADAVTQYRMTAAAGTFCYIDPEYQKTGLLGIKSDIYALGIILLQLVTGKPPMGLAHNVESAMETGSLEKILDPLVPDWPLEDTLNYTKLAMKCAELRHRDRPDLGTVVLPELNRLRELGEQSSSISNARYKPSSDNQEVFSQTSTEVSGSIDDDLIISPFSR